MMYPIKVFLSIRPVMKFASGICAAYSQRQVRYFAEWIARGTSTQIYRSKTCDTREEAEALARKYMRRLSNLNRLEEA